MISARLELALGPPTRRHNQTPHYAGCRGNELTIQWSNCSQVSARMRNTSMPASHVPRCISTGTVCSDNWPPHMYAINASPARCRKQSPSADAAASGHRVRCILQSTPMGLAIVRLNVRQVCAWPPGDPEDVQLKYVSDESVDSPEAVSKAAFGPEADMTDLHASMLPGMLAQNPRVRRQRDSDPRVNYL